MAVKARDFRTAIVKFSSVRELGFYTFCQVKYTVGLGSGKPEPGQAELVIKNQFYNSFEQTPGNKQHFNQRHREHARRCRQPKSQVPELRCGRAHEAGE